MKTIAGLLACICLLSACASAETVTVTDPYAVRQAIAAERQAAAMEALTVQISSMNFILQNIAETQSSYMITIPQVSYTLSTSSPIPVKIINDYQVVYSTR